VSDSQADVLIVGGGIGGLALALSLHQAGIASRVFEAAPDVLPLGVGINLLPHAMRELSELGLQEALAAHAIETRELAFYSRHGQFIYKEPRGRFAGYDWPQLSIHRADLHQVMLETVRARLGSDAVRLAHRCLKVDQDGAGVVIHFDNIEPQRGKVAVGCDGIHSALRRQLVPGEGPPKYSGVNMWRGAVRWPAYLGGDTMVSTGWMTVGKTVIYPVRPGTPETAGLPLINWVAEIERPEAVRQDWTGRGRLGDIMPAFAGLKFDWLDISGMIESTEEILEYPMVDRDPLPRWSFGRITLLGDAAHPMYPRGSNGGGQAILDARVLAGCLRREKDVATALKVYEAARLKPAYEVVIANRSIGPDAILRTVHERTGDKPFERIEDVIGEDELRAMAENYKRIAGFERETLKGRPSLV
jgi:5-methylphenazine-1-carboxylate 1-monooxygenase